MVTDVQEAPYVKVHLTPKQAEAVRKACEFYARVVNGQFSEIAFECGTIIDPNILGLEQYHRAVDLLYKARALLYPDLRDAVGASYGIGWSDFSDVVWDIHTSIRHALYKAKMSDTGKDSDAPLYCNVAADPPMQWGSEPICEVIVHGKLKP